MSTGTSAALARNGIVKKSQQQPGGQKAHVLERPASPCLEPALDMTDTTPKVLEYQAQDPVEDSLGELVPPPPQRDPPQNVADAQSLKDDNSNHVTKCTYSIQNLLTARSQLAMPDEKLCKSLVPYTIPCSWDSQENVKENDDNINENCDVPITLPVFSNSSSVDNCRHDIEIGQGSSSGSQEHDGPEKKESQSKDDCVVFSLLGAFSRLPHCNKGSGKGLTGKTANERNEKENEKQHETLEELQEAGLKRHYFDSRGDDDGSDPEPPEWKPGMSGVSTSSSSVALPRSLRLADLRMPHQTPWYVGLNLQKYRSIFEAAVKKFASQLAKDFHLQLSLPDGSRGLKEFSWPNTLHITTFYGCVPTEVLKLEGAEWNVQFSYLLYIPDAILMATVSTDGIKDLPMETNTVPHVTLLTKLPFRPRNAGDLMVIAQNAGLLDWADSKASRYSLEQEILMASIPWCGSHLDVYIQHTGEELLRGFPAPLQKLYGTTEAKTGNQEGKVPMPSFVQPKPDSAEQASAVSPSQPESSAESKTKRNNAPDWLSDAFVEARPNKAGTNSTGDEHKKQELQKDCRDANTEKYNQLSSTCTEAPVEESTCGQSSKDEDTALTVAGGYSCSPGQLSRLQRKKIQLEDGESRNHNSKLQQKKTQMKQGRQKWYDSTGKGANKVKHYFSTESSSVSIDKNTCGSSCKDKMHRVSGESGEDPKPSHYFDTCEEKPSADDPRSLSQKFSILNAFHQSTDQTAEGQQPHYFGPEKKSALDTGDPRQEHTTSSLKTPAAQESNAHQLHESPSRKGILW
eukprot:gnl/MRDRNA2_/MRDRNA2_57101_c0_seq1.p1 gnl/MRDRNA2_/MRDRNA2_57101_c0~~gnl/MRDRNA2_/MRDRNA2_57101_c0_seq1.p1  ORF type:complete len:799 (+),score=147.03 gnl/MRDRNA2_/MRDRNA2_57101_c0_seq1:216-2612(+)